MTVHSVIKASVPADAAVSTRADLVQSVSRSLRILNCLATSVGGLKLSEVAREAGTAVSTTHRLLTTLEDEGYVVFDQRTKRWRVGLQAFTVGQAFSSNALLAAALPPMRVLSDLTCETVSIGRLLGDHAVYWTRIEGPKTPRSSPNPSARTIPAHASGIGKAILAYQPGADSMESSARLSALTPRTLASVSALKADLASVTARGFALDLEEHEMGVRCVAAPIFNEHGDPIAAISVSGAADRIVDLDGLGAMVRSTAAEITIGLGGRPRS